MKRPRRDLGVLIILWSGFACGGRTDLSAFLSVEEGGDGDGEPSGSGGDDAPTSGDTGSGGRASGGAPFNNPAGGAPGVMRCPDGTFDADRDVDGIICRPWSACRSGEYVAAAPSAWNDRSCSACPDGTFSSAENELECQPWTSCNFGAIAATMGTSTSDVECRDPDTFGPVDVGEQLEAQGMTATSGGIYLGLNLVKGPTPLLFKQTLDGSSPQLFQAPSEAGGRITDMTSLGTEIYVALLNNVASGLENQTARLVRFDADGMEQVMLDLEPEQDEWLLNVLVTTDGTDVIVARQVLPVDCTTGGDCAPGVESHVILARFDHNLGLITETRHPKYFNFGAIGDLEVSGDNIFLSGELTGNSGIHSFAADLSVLKKYDDFETGGNIGYVLAPGSNGLIFSLSSEADPVARTLALLDGTTAQLLGQAPQEIADGVFELLAMDQELLMLARARATDQNVFTRMDHQGGLIDEHAEDKDFTYLTELVLAPNGEVFVGGVGDDGRRQVGIIRPWPQ